MNSPDKPVDIALFDLNRTSSRETAPGAIAVGQDGALYVAEVSNVPYSGYSSIERIPLPAFAPGSDAAIYSAPQTYASGFSGIVSLGFNRGTGDLYVLQNLDTNLVNDAAPNTDGPLSSELVRVALNGVRTTISGPELENGQFLWVDQKSGDVYVSTSGSAPGGGELLDYRTDPATGAVTSTVVAAGSATLPSANDLFFGSGTLALPALPGGEGGHAVSKLVVFGDRLADNGNTAAQYESLGETPYFSMPPYSLAGDFSDGPSWTTNLAQLLGGTAPVPIQSLAYQGATAGPLGAVPDPFDPETGLTPLNTFAGQVQQFEQGGGSFAPTDLVSLTFGANDIPKTVEIATDETPQQAVTDSVNAIVSGMGQLADLGAKHFLVSNVPDITLSPVFSSPPFQVFPPGLFAGLVSQFNTELAASLQAFQSQSGLDVRELDLNTLFNGIVANPLDYGFTNVTQPVLLNLGNAQLNPPGVGPEPTYNPAINGQNPLIEHGSLFIDPLFDTTELSQQLIAQTARNALVS